jgi:hypothetical protein
MLGYLGQILINLYPPVPDRRTTGLQTSQRAGVQTCQIRIASRDSLASMICTPKPTILTSLITLLRMPCHSCEFRKRRIYLAYTQENSPWCSSASDSNYSTQSDGSRTGRQWSLRARSASVHTVPDWPTNTAQFSPHNIIGTPQDLRNGQFDSILEQYETPYTSPRMTPSSLSRHLLDVPSSNSFGGYYMESVGTPALSTYSKPLAQIFSASPSRISDSRLGGIDFKRKEFVEPQLGMSSINAHLAHLDPYLSSYWHSFDQHFPIIHRGTFDPAENNLLTFAMAAIGTQYRNTIEARQKGVELNDYCRKNIDHVSLAYFDQREFIQVQC